MEKRRKGVRWKKRSDMEIGKRWRKGVRWRKGGKERNGEKE